MALMPRERKICFLFAALLVLGAAGTALETSVDGSSKDSKEAAAAEASRSESAAAVPELLKERKPELVAEEAKEKVEAEGGATENKDDEEKDEDEDEDDDEEEEEEDDDYVVPEEEEGNPWSLVTGDQLLWVLGCKDVQSCGDEWYRNGENKDGRPDMPWLQEEPDIPLEIQLDYSRNGHTVTRGLFSAEQMEVMRPAIIKSCVNSEIEVKRHMVGQQIDDDDEDYTEQYAALDALSKADVLRKYRKVPFKDKKYYQALNIWRLPVDDTDPRVDNYATRQIVLSKRLASTAAQLLGCDRVRVYQDSIFGKQPGFGKTSWHVDLNMAPIDGNDFVTAWMPLHPMGSLEEGASSLVFASGSHLDYASLYWYHRDSTEVVKDSLDNGEPASDRYGSPKSHGAMALGDATWHSGWVSHVAVGNEKRLALTVSYICHGTTMETRDDLERTTDLEDWRSYKAWIGDVKDGQVVDHPLVPLVYDKAGLMPTTNM